jgi:hypothetical protein
MVGQSPAAFVLDYIIPEHLFYVKRDFSPILVWLESCFLKPLHLIVYTSSLLYHFS